MFINTIFIEYNNEDDIIKLLNHSGLNIIIIASLLLIITIPINLPCGSGWFFYCKYQSMQFIKIDYYFWLVLHITVCFFFILFLIFFFRLFLFILFIHWFIL